MSDDRVREDLALIREAIEGGRRYATAYGAGMVVWGLALAVGFAATYAFVRGWSGIAPRVLWPVMLAIPWGYSLRRAISRTRGHAAGAVGGPMVTALRMLWIGLGVFLTILTLAALWTGEVRLGWLDAVVTGTLGAGVFATTWLTGMMWLRWIALAWWAGEIVTFALRDRPEALLLSAGLMLALLAGPGVALAMRRRKLAAA